MKKLSSFLVAVMMFVMIATAMGRADAVQAMTFEEIDHTESLWFTSTKAGTSVYFRYSLNYETANEVDITGWTAALCPAGNATLDSAVYTVSLNNNYKFVNEQYKYAMVSLSVTLDKDIPEGEYGQAFFDATGALVWADTLNINTYINKTIVQANCWLMNNDGYAYAYVYSESPLVNASTYPTFYATDKTTPVTSFVDYTVGKNQYGDTVHYYKLKISDAEPFAFDENGTSYVYYSIGTPNLPTGNDGGVGMYRCNANGIGWTSAIDLNLRAQKQPEYFKVEDPFKPAPSPTTSTVVTPPTTTEVVLPGGQEAHMVTANGNPNTYVIGAPEVVPTGATFSSTPIITGEGYTSSAAAVEKFVGKGLEIAVFEMDLTAADGTAIHQLKDYVNVTMLIPSGITLDEGKTLVVYRYENGGLTRCDTAIDGKFLTFATNHFSTFVIVEQDASAGPALIKGSASSPKTSDVSMLPAMMGVIATMGIAVAAKKKNEI